MEDNKEVMEEIVDSEEVILDAEPLEMIDEDVKEEVAADESNKPEETKTEDEKVDEEPKKKTNKALWITLLSILLVIDVAFLIIYIIGIDKVLGFIK